jgi:hypothetical protein
MENKNLWNYFVSKNHILPSPIANKIGLPLVRTFISDILIKLRRFKNCRPKSIYEKQLINDGIVVIPNFLPSQEFIKLKEEYNQIFLNSQNLKIKEKGSVKIEIHPMTNEESKKFPMMENFSKNKELIRLISVGEGVNPVEQIKNFNLENSSFGDPQDDTDENVKFHCDIHFDSHKVLYYVSDVSEEDAPFIYCKKSHKNNFQRMWYELQRGQLKDSHKDSYRIENHLDKKIFFRYFKKLMKQKYKVISPENTLVIANVHGFHKRGEAIKDRKRSIIRIPNRYNPLGPSKNIPPDLYNDGLF